MSSRLSLLLPPMGKRKASGGSVVRMGGHQPEDWGSEHVAGNHRQTGASLSTVSVVSVQRGSKHLCVCIIRRQTCSGCSSRWRQAVNWRRWSSEWSRCWIRSSQIAGKNCRTIKAIQTISFLQLVVLLISCLFLYFVPFAVALKWGATLSETVAVCDSIGSLFEAPSGSPPTPDCCCCKRFEARPGDRTLYGDGAGRGLGQQAQIHGRGGETLS